MLYCLLLHPYNETGWNDQVLKESEAERVVRAVVHAQKTLEAGFTTVRDLGSEGAGYADVGLKTSIEKGVIPGPRMIVAGNPDAMLPKVFEESLKNDSFTGTTILVSFILQIITTYYPCFNNYLLVPISYTILY